MIDTNMVVRKIYKEAFKEAYPSIDFDYLISSGEAKNPDFFKAYYLSEPVLYKIVEKISSQDS